MMKCPYCGKKIETDYMRGYDDAMRDSVAICKAVQAGKDGEAILDTIRSMQVATLIEMREHPEGGDPLPYHLHKKRAASILCSILLGTRYKNQKEEKPENTVFSGLINDSAP